MRPCRPLLSTLLLGAALASSPNSPAQAGRHIFEDDRIRVEIPAGWSIHTAIEHVRGDKPFELPIGALLTKGKYRIYLLTHKQQASGIEGGRFSEVVNYVSPWIDMSESPWLPCPSELHAEESSGKTLAREDFYFDTKHASAKDLSDCGNPPHPRHSMVWLLFRGNLPRKRYSADLRRIFSYLSESFRKATSASNRTWLND